MPLAPAGEQPPEAVRLSVASASLEHADDFYALSAQLTGFSETELQATGVGDMYLDWLNRVFSDLLGPLFDAWQAIAGKPPAERDAALRSTILGDEQLGPLARSLTMLWYTANWTRTASWKPPHASTLEPARPDDVDAAFGAAYPEGLVWRAARTHPVGAKPTGFGSWALAPPKE